MLNYKVQLLWKFYDRYDRILWLELEHGYEDPAVRLSFEDRQRMIQARDRIADALGL